MYVAADHELDIVASSAPYQTRDTYQFQIMESIGVPRFEMKKFAYPYHWLAIGVLVPVAERVTKQFAEAKEIAHKFCNCVVGEVQG